MKILDLCCGRVPWIARNFIWKLDDVGTELSDSFSSVPKGALYLCVDNDASVLSRSKEIVGKIAKIDDGVFCGDIQFVRADARKLNLTHGSFDVVILADFINAPSEDYNYGGERASTGLSDEAKSEIIETAIALLKPNGRLVVAIYETPQHAERIATILATEPRLVIIEQYGGIDETWGRGKRCICEFVFQKTNPNAKPCRTRINDKQRRYLEKLAAEDKQLDLGDLNDLVNRGLIWPA